MEHCRGGVALKSITSGQSNTALGVIALGNITTQSNNTAVGYLAGHYRTSISEGTFLGANSYPSTNTTNVTGVGYNSRPTKSNQLVLGNSAVTEILYYGKWASGSDARYKNNIREDVSGLDFILKLRPVTYNMDIHKLADLLKEDTQIDEEGNEKMGAPNEATLKARDKKSAIIYSGFIAQEVEAVAKEVGYDFSGVIAPENDHDYYKLDYISLTVPIVKAIQEQQVQIELLEPAAVEALQAEVQALRAENEIMKDQLSQILSLLKEQGIDLGSGSAGNPSRGSGRSPRNAYGNSAQLEQNTPNPFHENTSIRYFLPENAGKAQIVITDLQGNRIQTLNIGGSGFGEVTIHSGSLAPGTYVYSLVVGGELADSKRMVLVL